MIRNVGSGATRGKTIIEATFFPAAKFHACVLSNTGGAADLYILFIPGAKPAASVDLGARPIAALQLVPAGTLGSLDYGASGRPTPDGFYIAVTNAISDLDTLETAGVTFAPPSDMRFCDVTYS